MQSKKHRSRRHVVTVSVTSEKGAPQVILWLDPRSGIVVHRAGVK